MKTMPVAAETVQINCRYPVDLWMTPGKTRVVMSAVHDKDAWFSHAIAVWTGEYSTPIKKASQGVIVANIKKTVF